MVDVVGLPGCHGADASSVRVRALSVGQRIQTLGRGRTPEARSPKAPARGRRSAAPIGSQRNLRNVNSQLGVGSWSLVFPSLSLDMNPALQLLSLPPA